MSGVGAVRRALKYQAKMTNRVWSNPDLSLQLSNMITFYGESASMYADVEDTVAGVLTIPASPLSTTQLAQFYNCGRQLKSLSVRVGFGSAATSRAQIIKDRWTTEGLASADLISVAAAFGYTVT